MIPRGFLTPDEAADYLGCGVSTIRELAKRGKIAHYRPPPRGQLSFTREDLDAYLDSCRVPVKEEAKSVRTTRRPLRSEHGLV